MSNVNSRTLKPTVIPSVATCKDKAYVAVKKRKGKINNYYILCSAHSSILVCTLHVIQPF